MDTLFLVAAVAGGAVLLLQLLLGFAGFDADIGDVDAGEAFSLLSVRAVAAGAVFFGITALALRGAGLGLVPTLMLALVAGGVAAAAVTAAVRAMLRLQGDGTVRVQDAVGSPATVYLRIPGERAGTGKIQLALQERTVELQAVTSEGELPTGSRVVVVEVLGPDTVLVAAERPIEELLYPSPNPLP